MKQITVPRHVAATDQYRNSLAYESGQLEELLPKVRDSADKLESVYRSGIVTAQLGSVVDDRSQLVTRGLRLAAEAIAGNFRLLRGSGRRTTIRLDGVKLTYAKAAPNRAYLTPGDWIKGFCMAMICRELKLLDDLCLTTGSDLRPLSASSAEHRFLLVDGIRQTWQGQDPSEALLAAMAAGDPKRPEVQDFADAVRADVLVIQLVFYIATGDPDFGKLHAEAVKRHNAHWTKTARRKISWHGFLSIELTALAAWAHEWKRGSLAVRSDYVPEHLVNGEFLK